MTFHTDTAWQLTGTEPGPELILFHTRYDRWRNPRNGKTIKAVVLESRDWVNVVALTPEQKLVVVSQLRFGTGQLSVEMPAGLIEPDEQPLQAAMRELQEETGYVSEDWHYLGQVQANPAFLTNVCHLWLARDVVQTHALHLDDSEEIAVAELTWDEVRGQIAQGHMRNAMSLLALARVFDLRHQTVSLKPVL